jgi:histidinol-phosphate phosphatase family protein
VLPGTPEALKRLKKMGMALVVVSNQSGVARGMFTIEDVEAANTRMKELFAMEKIEFDAIYFCPHLEGCRCRKPSGGMVERARKELEVDPSRSYVIGDRVSDLGLARAVGARAVLVLTGYGSETLKELDSAGLAPDHIATDLQAAVDWITKMENSK